MKSSKPNEISVYRLDNLSFHILKLLQQKNIRGNRFVYETLPKACMFAITIATHPCHSLPFFLTYRYTSSA